MASEELPSGGLPGVTRAASFRDPSGSLFLSRNRAIRYVRADAAGDLLDFLVTKTAAARIGRGELIGARRLDSVMAQALLTERGVPAEAAADPDGVYLEHDRVWFPSYPYEWPSEMLHAAAELTLGLAVDCLEEGFCLKDATPYNVLFQGTRPLFVDWLSFEKRDPADPLWLASAQFERTFLLPLLANRRLGLPLSGLFLTQRDGLEPGQVYDWLKPLDRLRFDALTLVSIPAWLGSRKGSDDPSVYRPRRLSNPEKARFVLDMHLRRLSRGLRRLTPETKRTSRWSGYMTGRPSYQAAAFEAKEKFVAAALAECAPQRVLDIGCNTGHFSLMAARTGAQVVAIDADPVVVGEVYRAACAQALNVLPLTVDFTRPTPATGWRNAECASFMSRAHGAFDAVLMLAVLHHILAGERVPLEQVLDQAADLTTRWLLIEYVGTGDPMFRKVARGREALHAGFTVESFEAACRRRFEIARSQRLPDSERILYLLRKLG